MKAKRFKVCNGRVTVEDVHSHKRTMIFLERDLSDGDIEFLGVIATKHKARQIAQALNESADGE